MKHFVLAAALCAATAAAAADGARVSEHAGYDRFAVAAAHRAGLMQASVWYPVGRKTYLGQVGGNALFRGERAYIGADIAEGRLPLLLLSHGSGGNMDGLAWLSSRLALRGAMVLAVNHPGSTSGDSSPRRTIKIWERPADLSAALDHLLADPVFAAHVDRDRIVAMGFSAGGVAALQMIGLQPDKDLYRAYCERFGEAAQDCAFYAKGGVDLGRLPARFNRPTPDPRVSGVIAFEPGMSYAVSEEAAAAIEAPVLLVNFGEKGDRWPAADLGPEGSDLAARLPNSDHVVIAPGHHFSFLAECTERGAALLAEEEDDPICDDPEGTDRAALHRRVIEAVAAFLSL